MQGSLWRLLQEIPTDSEDPKTFKARIDLRRAYNAATDIVEIAMRLRLERLI